MQALTIDALYITPRILHEIACILDSQWLESWYSPNNWKISWDNRSILDAVFEEDIESDADTIRDELDDVIIWLQWLKTLIKKAQQDLDKAFPNVVIHHLHESLEYLNLIIPHAEISRRKIIDINLAIDPKYPFVNLPEYTAIT